MKKLVAVAVLLAVVGCVVLSVSGCGGCGGKGSDKETPKPEEKNPPPNDPLPK